MATTARKPRNSKKIETTNPTPKGRSRVLEAPDRGQSAIEAPEVRKPRHEEAPDWGEARDEGMSSDFTHGRSQS